MGIDLNNGTKVALKSVRITSREQGIPRAVFRELESLRQLNEHVGIVKLLDVYPDETNLCLVLEYHPSDLSIVIDNAKDFIPMNHIKLFAYMIIDAIEYIHSNHIIHRDIKPSSKLNILILLHFILLFLNFYLYI